MEEPVELHNKVESWLKKQGYPLEFRTAHILHAVGFDCLQGYYVPDQASKASREIDILARLLGDYSDRSYIALNFVVECKYSRDHPWVIFVSGSTGMAASAHIAQLTSSKLGKAIAYVLAGEPALAELELFSHRIRGGFGGCSSLRSDKQDQKDPFYSAIQSVAAKALLARNEDDIENVTGDEFPSFGGVYMPMIVIDGKLFESWYDPTCANMELRAVGRSRVYWRGLSHSGPWIVPVDIVTIEELQSYATNMANESKLFMQKMVESAVQLKKAYDERDLSSVEVKSASRGFTGSPQLLRMMMERQNAAKNAKIGNPPDDR
jgi:hypothetical protein